MLCHSQSAQVLVVAASRRHSFVIGRVRSSAAVLTIADLTSPSHAVAVNAYNQTKRPPVSGCVFLEHKHNVPRLEVADSFSPSLACLQEGKILLEPPSPNTMGSGLDLAPPSAVDIFLCETPRWRCG